MNIRVTIPVGTGYNQFKTKIGGFKPSWIIIHHSWTVDGTAKNWDAIRAYHMSYRHNGDTIPKDEYDKLRTQGATGLQAPWKDIAYNLGIENIDGKLQILSGREIGSVGAHAIGFNDNSVGICLVGNYDQEPPDDDRMFMLSMLCRQLQLAFGIVKQQVVGHRETFALRGVSVEKTCPGASFNMDKFRDRLRA